MNPRDRRNPARKILTRIVELLSRLPGADRIQVRRYQIQDKKIPAAFDGYRIVQLSDLHGRWFGLEQRDLIQKVAALAPDLIVVTGDWIDSDYQGDDRQCSRALVKGLLPLAPVYGIIGNHEARARHRSRLVQELRELGVHMLLDESAVITKDRESIRLTGFITSYYAPLKEEPADYTRLFKKYSEAVKNGSQLGVTGEQKLYTIALGHRPELLGLYEQLQLDLVLAGHAHGGLMKLPGGRRLLAPGQGWLPQYTHGAYRQGKTRMLVSCGLGGPRIGIAPEITVIRLRSKSNEIRN